MKAKWCAVAALFLFSAGPALGAEEIGTVKLPAGVIKIVRGAVSIDRAGQGLPAQVGSLVIPGDTLTTGVDGSVGITLRDCTVLSAGPNSSLVIRDFAFNPSTHAGTLDAGCNRGAWSVISGKLSKASPDAVRFSTPVSLLGVRGTEFIIDCGPGK